MWEKQVSRKDKWGEECFKFYVIKKWMFMQGVIWHPISILSGVLTVLCSSADLSFHPGLHNYCHIKHILRIHVGIHAHKREDIIVYIQSAFISKKQ